MLLITNHELKDVVGWFRRKTFMENSTRDVKAVIMLKKRYF
jgi:hypothetical protein